LARLYTFKELIEDKCFDDIYEIIRIYVEDNPDKFAGESSTVDDPDEAELSDIEAQFVIVHEKPNNHLKFTVVVSAEIEISQRMPHSYSESDGIGQWFAVECSGVLENGLNHFETHGVTIYNRYKQQKEGKLSEYLVPITYKEQLDDIAEAFLIRHYPEALEKPIAIDVIKLAEKMGLTIEYLHLSKACTFLGQIYFSNSEVKYYDPDSGVYKSMDVDKGTIIVDPNTFFLSGKGRKEN